MSKKKHRQSTSGSPAGDKYGDGNTQTKSHQNNNEKSKTSNSVDRREPGPRSSPPSPSPLSRSPSFLSPLKKDPGKSLSETSSIFDAKSKAPDSTQPASKSAWVQTQLSPPFPTNIPSTAPAGGRTSSSNTIISIPTDRKSDPKWIQRQMAVVRQRAVEKPSFSTPAEQVDGINDKNGKNSKGKKRQTGSEIKKAKRNKKKSKNKDEDKNTDAGKSTNKNKTPSPPVESPKAAERRKQKNAARREREAKKKREMKDSVEVGTFRLKTEEGVDQAQRVLGMYRPNPAAPNMTALEQNLMLTTRCWTVPAASLKRKFDDPNSNVAFNSRLDAETRAIKRLREALPGTKLTRVSQKLEQECGTHPTAMAVLVEAARETILDLARGQMRTTIGFGGGQESLSGEVLRMLTEQKGRIDRLELAADKPKASTDEDENDGEEPATAESSDSSNNGEEGEDKEEENVESDQEVATNEDTSSSGSSSDSD